MLQRFFAESREHFQRQWAESKPGDLEVREEAYRFLSLTRSFEQYFKDFLVNEEYAKAQLAEKDNAMR